MLAARLINRSLAFLTRHWPALAIGAALTIVLHGPGGFDLASNPVTAPLCLIAGILIERTFAAAGWAPPDRGALIAYLPLGVALLAWFVARTSAKHAVRSGSLDQFYSTAAPLLGLLLISIVIEARQLAPHDPWFRAFRGWWMLLIVMGVLYALVGLTPGHTPKSEEMQYVVVWAALANAITALVILTWRRPPAQHDLPDGSKEDEAAGPSQSAPTPTSTFAADGTPTRTPAPSTRA